MVLKKYDVGYYQCTNCGFMQTDIPFWINEAYSSAITSLDIGLVYRNLLFSPVLSTLINLFYNKKGKFLDYGGGYGLLTRIMRDRGFDYYRFDTYCENIFVKDFDVSNSDPLFKYELVSAFEVFEHLVDPVEELKKILQFGKSVFFSTEIIPSKINSPEDWWYIAPETGQHIAFYTHKSLSLLGEKYGLNFYSNGYNLHLFTPKKISNPIFKLIIKYRIAKFFDLLLPKNESLLVQDFMKIR